MNGIVGQVILFAGSRTPLGWFVCTGQEMQISQYPALFSIVGTIYGGDGIHTFALPKLTCAEDPALKYLICYQGEYPQFY
jgi:microcystin-dependent protein